MKLVQYYQSLQEYRRHPLVCLAHQLDRKSRSGPYPLHLPKGMLDCLKRVYWLLQNLEPQKLTLAPQMLIQKLGIQRPRCLERYLLLQALPMVTDSCRVQMERQMPLPLRGYRTT